MNYGGNLPDWHQFNASQTNEVTPNSQNVNSGHLAFIPGVSPPTLNAHSLSSDGLNKHQTESNYNSRNFQLYNNVSSGPNLSNNSPLASMVQMQNCIGHYGSPNTRNPMLDNLNASVDPRNTVVGTINDEIGYRNNQVPFNGPIGHLNGPNCNINASTGPASGPGPRTTSVPGSGTNPVNGIGSGSIYGSGPRHGPVSGSGPGPGNMGPRNTNIGSVPLGKPGPSSFVPCKGLCCNSDPNMNYQQWEKFGSYQNNTSYRDNVHPPGYQIENRHFGNNCNFRKDNLEGKETMTPVMSNASAVDHRRNFTDYKYHKDHLTHRNYPASSGMFHNYPVQNYNYSTEHQKYPYPVKEHPKTNNMNMSNPGMLKHQDQNFIAQQKFNNKQFQYQNGNMLPKGVPTMNVNGNMASTSQNLYFNSQYARNIPTEIAHECQETTDNGAVINRMPGTYMHNSSAQQQTNQHKIAIQKFSIENHLREMSRTPGYQSHPRYKECVLRYRELLKLQQSTGYQNPVQQTPRVATPVNTAVPPINLQFDQNGMLINSNFITDGFSKLQHAPSMEQQSEAMEKQQKDQAIAIANEKCQQTQQPGQLMIPSEIEHVPSSCAETFQKQNQFPIHKDFNQNQLKVQTSESHRFDTLNTDTSNKTMMQQKASKQFANKPDLDVRQFLANWDETDDEEGPTSSLPDTVLSDTTPVVVVSYENVDLSSKSPQSTEVTRRNSFDSNKTPLDNEKEAEANMITTQDCLAISYSPPESAEIAKTTKRTIGEGVVKPGSIIHCISNGPDEIPTIHIVDNLEISNILGASNDQVIETLEKQKTISFFRETTNNETEATVLKSAEQHNKNETCILSANYSTSLANVNKVTNIQDSRISETIQTDTTSINNQELRVLSAKSNLDVTDNLDLKKQSSFASEESHNPDDISLPDLPTSECTPISTTLNTPIHSDSEESSQNIEDLSISTNPIEVMQNSPVISFTQSPVKMEPYGQLNNEDKLKNRSLGTLELEFQKENRYKNSAATSNHEQEVIISNFDFSPSNSKTKSAEIVKDKQVKNLETNLARKKVFLIDGKENDIRVSDTCAALTSIAYELEVQQEIVESEKNSECESPNSVHGEKHKARRSTDSTKSVIQNSDSTADVDNIACTVISTASNANLTSPTESDDETQTSKHERALSKRQKIKSLNVSINTINPTLTEVNLNARKRIKGSGGWEDKCIDRNADKLIKVQKKNVEHLTQLKHSDIKRFAEDDSNSSQGDEHSVCHMTSQSKNYSVTVIKDNVILSDQKSRGTTEKNINICCEKSSEFQLRTNNTKELSEEIELKKHVHSKNFKRSEILHKDLETIDGDVKFTTDEINLLNEYRRKKDRLYQDKSMEEKLQKVNDNIGYHKTNKMECSQLSQNKELSAVRKVSLEQNVSSPVSSENLEIPEETNRHTYSKSFVKNVNSDFGIQVANVNLKIKDSELGKDLILGDNGQEHVKDSLDGIKIEINFSRAERNSKGQEQNKRLLYENFRTADDRNVYEIDNSLSYPVASCSNNALDCQHRLSSKKQETSDNTKIYDTIHNIPEKSLMTVDASEANKTENNIATSAVGTSASTTLNEQRRNSLKADEDALVSITSKGMRNSTSESRNLNKLLHNNASSKDSSRSEIIAGTNYSLDVDMTKSKCAISNTAIVDADNKILIKAKNKFEGEDSSMNVKDDRIARIQKQSFNLVESSSQATIEALKNDDEKEATSVSHMLKNTKKLPELNLIELSAKSLSTLNTLDFTFDKLDYKKCSDVNFDRVHTSVEEVDEMDDNYVGKWKKPKINHIFEDCDMFQSTSGYINPIFSSVDKLENLHTVPVYTTKDGKISYSPNRRFAHQELMMETRKREGCSSMRKPHYTDTWNSYYSSKFRKLYKKKRYHGLSDKKKHEFKDTKCLYERKKNYVDDFCGRNHVKYKEYVHKNNNPVECKMYSSSDSDEEIIDRSKYRIGEISNYKKNHVIENKAITIISKSHKRESVADDSDLKNKNKESTAFDIHSSKSEDILLEEMQSLQSRSENDLRNNLASEELATVILNPNCGDANENIKFNGNKSPMPTKTHEFTSESLRLNRDQNLNDKCASPSPIVNENTNISSDDKEAIGSRDKCSSSKVLEGEALSNENEQMLNSYSVKEKENDEVHVEEQNEENNLEISENQTSILETEGSSENIDRIENCEDLETKKSESEVNEANCISTDAILDLYIDADNTNKQKSEESKSISTEIIETLSNKDISEIDEEKFLRSEESILICEQESNKIETLNEEQKKHEESTNRDIKENIASLEYRKNDSPTRSSKANIDTYMNQEEFESRIVQVDTSDQQNSEHIFIDTVNNDKDLNTNSEQGDSVVIEKYEELICVDLSKNAVYIEDDNTIDNSAVLHRDEVKVEENYSNKVQSKDEDNFNQDSSIEEEMPVLSLYCTIKDFSAKRTECRKNETVENEQKENQCQSSSLISYKSSNDLPENNIDMKAIPKLVIKKTETFSSKSECSLDSTEPGTPANRYDTKLLTDVRQKIPKMIIMNSRSRSVTPTIEILDRPKFERIQTIFPEHNDTSMDVDNSDSELDTLKSNNYASKVPKVKIKLEDISSKDLKLYLKRKAIKQSESKKVKKMKTQESKTLTMKYETEDSSETDSVDTDDDDDKAPKLKLRMQEEDKSLSPDRTRGKDTSISKTSFKRTRRTKEENGRHSVKYDKTTTNDDEIRKKYPQCITEKIPKVIIKRTQIGTEFKCEISKSKKTLAIETSKWQPKVKLQRLQVLDHMVMDLNQSKVTLKNKSAINTLSNMSAHIADDVNDTDSCHDTYVKLCRSSSASNLSRAKCKQRRLSNPDYMKVDTKLITDFVDSSSGENKYKSLNINEVKVDSDSKNLKRNSKKRPLLNKKMDHGLNDDSESETKDSIVSKNTTENSFKNLLINEDNDLVVKKKKSFGIKESISCIEDRFVESGIRSRNFDDIDNSIIKVDSSDESQTTIELLPASPDSSDDESKNREFDNTNKIHINGAVPTQLELELELMDNNEKQRSDTLVPKINELSFMDIEKCDHPSHSRKYTDEESTKTYFSDLQYSSQSTYNQNKIQRLEKKSNDYFYCNDLLVKEVLAAKETLKKCLTRCANENTEMTISRHKTVAEKKQGLSFNFKDLDKSHCKPEDVHGKNMKIHKKSGSTEETEHKFIHKLNIEKIVEKHSKEDKSPSTGKKIKSNDLQDETLYSAECPTASTCGYTSVPEATTISLRATKKFSQTTTDEESSVHDPEDSQDEVSEKKMASSIQDQKDNDSTSETKAKEDNMPLLVPEFALNFDSSSDRDSSRSPPVITNQEELENAAQGIKDTKSKVISPIEKIEEDEKHSFKDCEMTIADIITQLAYHEKATIKHRRYCNLCERWFPTTSRHLRHLAGYQHRYMELTQRKSIHALFILFTGKPCPRLLPATVIRKDCSIGELTPLQIAVQDIANYVEHTQQEFKTKE
ncbi:uncharacterized protein LOC128874296 [Hylaeus volcanicus]|uniref:uncharacterized protein LOC128874296 n=1 Tax=Hylaeus volcanicus TaxID=313075 RepID=UPI0023B82989|nr:uncharacterized protein LOC128874296 [Hylaeus volcanicus]